MSNIYTSDYSFTWKDADKELPKDEKPVICFHCGCEFVGYFKLSNNLWFTKLGNFEAEVNVSYWKQIQA